MTRQCPVGQTACNGPGSQAAVGTRHRQGHETDRDTTDDHHQADSMTDIPHLDDAVAKALGVEPDHAAAIAAAAEPLWDALADRGIIDTYGGMECVRVLPAALAFIHQQANIRPRGPWNLPAEPLDPLGPDRDAFSQPAGLTPAPTSSSAAAPWASDSRPMTLG